ncbi:MAG: AMP-binding protein [Planctomycetes bacterium]|nr:AMP-binding protein [Planctomycetota bacterium]
MSASGTPTHAWNVASHLRERARIAPHSPALFIPRRGTTAVDAFDVTTFDELDAECERLARGLRAIGVERGERVALMVPPSLELFALTFALLRLGAILVLVDPGLGIRSLTQCLGEAAPRTFIGIGRAHVARRLFGWARASVERTIHVGSRAWGGVSLDQLRRLGDRETAGGFAEVAKEDPAAILFTSGSTGPPKGAAYTHGIFAHQVEWIRDAYAIEPGEIDLPTFPLFALFDPALGMAAVIPRMDFTRPGRVDPRQIVGPIQSFGVTNMFGSPAVVRRVGLHLEATRTKLPTLRRVISAGAPASPPDLARFRAALTEPDGDDGADLHTPYGATEALPLTTVRGREVLAHVEATRRGAGICVGRPLPGVTLEVIEIDDAPIEQWTSARRCGPGTIGEIVADGEVVTQQYHQRPEATRAAKIRDGDRVRHRLGDVGYFDDEGRLWFCGRKTHRVETSAGTLFTIACEGIFNAHPRVRRTALVGVGSAPDATPVLCVELEADVRRSERRSIVDELVSLGRSHEMTRSIETFLIHPRFPVDIRHNSKIFRERLSVWAAKRLR